MYIQIVQRICTAYSYVPCCIVLRVVGFSGACEMDSQVLVF